MRFIVLFILLSFPVIDLMVTMRFARWTGVPTLVWLLVLERCACGTSEAASVPGRSARSGAISR